MTQTLHHSYAVVDGRTGRIVAIYGFKAMAEANCHEGQYVRYIVTGRRH